VTCLGNGGERALALDGFFLGPGQTRRHPGELVTAVRLPALPPRSATAFLKTGRRKAMEISVACVAARLTVDAAGERCLEARVALGAVAPVPLRARAAERLLESQPLTPDVLRQAGQAAAGECEPITDVRASAGYRRRLIEALVPRALARCRERIER
jgi:carbon-monoxide dehydrogenase medium subunit